MYVFLWVIASFPDENVLLARDAAVGNSSKRHTRLKFLEALIGAHPSVRLESDLRISASDCLAKTYGKGMAIKAPMT